MPNHNKKGIILFIVIGIIIVVSALATVMLRVISSQSRITHHQVSRIQGLYAAKAGMVYALERLRLGTYKFSPTTNSCPNTTPPTAPACPVTDTNFPPAIKSVDIIFCPSGSKCRGSNANCTPPSGVDFCINTVVDYTYTP